MPNFPMKKVMVSVVIVSVILVFATVLGQDSTENEFQYQQPLIPEAEPITITQPSGVVQTITIPDDASGDVITITESSGDIAIAGGAIGAAGSIGFYQIDGTPVKVNQFMSGLTTPEGDPVAYLEAQIKYVELQGMSLKTNNLLVYLRLMGAKPTGEWIRVANDIVLTSADFHFNGQGFDDFTSIESNSWGTLDLSHQFFGWFQPKQMDIDSSFRVSLNQAATTLGLDYRQQSVQWQFAFEIIFECPAINGEVLSSIRSNQVSLITNWDTTSSEIDVVAFGEDEVRHKELSAISTGGVQRSISGIAVFGVIALALWIIWVRRK